MQYTNKLDLPQAIVDAVVNDSYSKGDSDISITGLISPPRIRVLAKKHEDKLVEDVSDRIFVLLGQVMHGILERSNRAAISEKRFYMDVDDVRVSGQLDAYYENGLVQDYKLVSLYSVKDGVKPEYEQQLNCYAALLRSNGMLVNKLELVCILRDWSKGKARQGNDVPEQQVLKLSVPVWEEEKALGFLKDRVAIHKAANKKLPLCTDEERWAVPDKWAVMPKRGAIKSIRNYEDKLEAQEHVDRVEGSFLEKRPGKQNRCADYCNVAEFCNQYQKIKKGVIDNG